MTLEELLDYMCRYGQPRLMNHKDRTWSCTVELDVSVSNTSFEVKSGYNEFKTAKSSALAAYLKLQEVLRQMKAKFDAL